MRKRCSTELAAGAALASSRRDSELPNGRVSGDLQEAAKDASIGVEQRSVVRNSRALAARVEAMLERWDEVLVQRYIDGREVNVGIIGDTALPIAEIDFGQMPRGMWRIVSYRSKWEQGSDEDLGGVPRCPADLPPDLAADIRRIALGAWRVVGGAGYGRVDMRIDAAGRPWILEVNANPDFAPDAGGSPAWRAAARPSSTRRGADDLRACNPGNRGVPSAVTLGARAPAFRRCTTTRRAAARPVRRRGR